MHTIHADVRSSDIIHALLSVQLRPANLLRSWLLWAVVVGVILVFLRGTPHSSAEIGVLMLASFGGAIGSVVVVLLCAMVKTVFVARSAPGVLGAHEFVLTDDGVFEK